jgi:elongation factor P
MIAASQLRVGMAIRFENQMYRVLAADYQPGQGKMGGVMHARLKNLSTSTVWEHGFRSDLKVEEIPVDKRSLEFLYRDADEYLFMDPATFEQIAVPVEINADAAQLLGSGMKVLIESVNNAPVSMTLPEAIEVTIADTAPPMHGAQDSTWKTAVTDNGLQVMVPPFVKIGDAIRLSTAGLKYLDRAKVQSR